MDRLFLALPAARGVRALLPFFTELSLSVSDLSNGLSRDESTFFPLF